MIVIGISGKKRSGKTEVANYIKSLAVNRVHIVSFADELKQDVAQMCGVSLDFIEQNKDDFRLILQGYGTNFRRKHCGDDYWIKRTLARMYSISNSYPTAIIVVPDTRFKNEGEIIYTINGFLLRIERPNNPEFHLDAHPSENELDKFKFDETIVNDGTIEQLHAKVQRFLTQTVKLKL